MRLRIGHLLFLLLIFLFAQPALATEITIVNLDGANEGFNDNTPAAPVGGNIGTTLGEQRLIVFQYVANIWESIISSNVEIKVEAKFDILTCSSSSAVLGSAGATQVFRDFPNAPVASTWYSVALANSLAGSDLSTSPDIAATFNSEIDNNNNCLNNTNWYYGIDGNKPANSIDLLSVVMHEIGHGLGFQTFVNTSTGAKLGNPGKNDAYMLRLEDHSMNKTWDQLSNAQRAASAIGNGDLHWVGSDVTSKVGNYTVGIDQGHVQQYAPVTLSPGSSVSHFDSALTPDELMEPFITQPKTGPGLAIDLMADIGWQIFPSFSPIISKLADVSVQQGDAAQVAFVVGDNDTSLASLTFSYTSSDVMLIDQSGFNVTGSGVSRTLNITPIATASGNASITVTISDGVNTAFESFQLTVINTPPSVTIDDPLDNENFTIADSILFQGSAIDTEDGDLSANIQWSSSIDGVFGVGNMINTVLSAGVHTISASVTDAGGLVSNDIVTVNIYGDSDFDGMNDLWELVSFGTLDRDGSGDFDGDGITDIDEYLISVTVPDGDINNDGIVNVADLLLAIQQINNASSLTALQVARGDVYPPGLPDGMVNVSDYILIQQLVLGP